MYSKNSLKERACEYYKSCFKCKVDRIYETLLINTKYQKYNSL